MCKRNTQFFCVCTTPWEQQIEVNKSDLILPCKVLAQGVYLPSGNSMLLRHMILSLLQTMLDHVYSMDPKAEERWIACCTTARCVHLGSSFRQSIHQCSSFCTDLHFPYILYTMLFVSSLYSGISFSLCSLSSTRETCIHAVYICTISSSSHSIIVLHFPTDNANEENG
jgi:hypothetical protein